MKKVIITGIVLLVLIITIIAFRVAEKQAATKQTITESVVSVNTIFSTKGDIQEVLNYTGTVEGIHEAMVISQTSGVATKVNINIGQKVGNGHVLAVIHNTQQEAGLEQAKAQLLASENNLEKAQADLSRIEKLYKENVATKDNLELSQLNVKAAQAQLKGAHAALKVAEKQLEDTYIKATIGGIISTKEIDQGATVMPGSKIAQIVDVSKFKIKIMVSEIDAVKLNIGKEVNVKLDALPEKVFIGKINSIGYSSQEGMRSYPVEVYIDNPGDNIIKSGMFARCEISARTKQGVIIVPSESVISNNDGTSTIYTIENNKAIAKKVTIGVKNNGSCEVVSGLAVNVKIATEGKERLKDGSSVKENGK